MKSVGYLLGVQLTEYLTGTTLAYMFYKQGMEHVRREKQQLMRKTDLNLAKLLISKEKSQTVSSSGNSGTESL